MSIRDIDLLAAELALLVQSGMNLSHERGCLAARLRDERISAQVPTLDSLHGLIAELLHAYSQIERAYLLIGTKKALAMNEISAEDKLSTCVEDVFFLMKKTTMRAATVGEWMVLLEVIEAVQSALHAEMIPAVQKRLRQLFPDTKTGGGDSIVVGGAG